MSRILLPVKKHEPRDLNKFLRFLTLDKKGKCNIHIKESHSITYCKFCKASTKVKSVNYVRNLQIFNAYMYILTGDTFQKNQMIRIADFCTDCYLSNFVVPLASYFRAVKWDEENLQIKIEGEFDFTRFLEDLNKWKNKCKIFDSKMTNAKNLRHWRK